MDDNADAKRILLASLQWTGEDNQDVPASRGSAPSSRIWDTTTLCSLKQQICVLELPSVEDVDVRRHASLELHAGNDEWQQYCYAAYRF